MALLVLVAVSVSMTVVAVGYGGVMVGVPYQDATPAQLASQQYHSGVFDWLMIGAGLMWLATVGAAIGLGVRWLATRTRPRTEESR